MRAQTVFVALALVLAPLGAQAADLVVWWEKGFYPQEDEAVRETIAAFEQETGKQVELVFQPAGGASGRRSQAALEAGQPPDFAFGVRLQDYIGPWAVDDRLVDLSDAVGHFSNLFDPDALAWVTWRDAKTGQTQPCTGCRSAARSTTSTFGRAFWSKRASPLADIPREWEAFWSFWCDQVQPAVRRATGREDIWGVGLPMSVRAGDTDLQFFQFVAAYDADYVTRDGRLVIDDPEIRQRLVKAIDSYTAIYRKGCTPPDSVTWDATSTTTRRSGPGGRHGAERLALDPQRAQARASGRLLQEHRHDRMATRPLWRALSDRWHRRFRRGLQGRKQRRHRQGVRPLPRGRGLARALSRLFGRALPAGDVEAARAAVLARSERSAPHGLGDAGRARGRWLTTTPRPRATGGTSWSTRSTSGRRRSTASSPRASAPSRRSTRRSRASSRSWRSDGHAAAASRALLAAALVLAPLGARAADLVVWWEKGFYPQEDEAVREIIAAFEQETGKQVELVLPSAG